MPHSVMEEIVFTTLSNGSSAMESVASGLYVDEYA